MRCSAHLLILAVGLAGCSAVATMSRHVGTCKEEIDACYARCARLVDSENCDVECEFEARQCNARQGDPQIAFREGSPVLGDDAALLVDLFDEKVMHSKDVTYEFKGDVRWITGAHEVSGGGGIALRYHVPPKTKLAELVLIHAPVGREACFITVTVGKKTLLGRYSPPRGEKVHAERFDITELLPEPPKSDAEPMVIDVFIYNNSSAGSIAPYRLASIQLFYKAPR